MGLTGWFLLTSIVFFIGAVSYTAYSIFRGSASVSPSNISIEISGPVSTPGGERLSLDVSVTNKNKVKSQVDVTPQKGTRKWETVYKAVTTWDQREVARDKSQTVCIKKARAFVEANPDVSLKVIIAKELTEGNSQCATVTYKKSTNEKLGLYKFVAWAAC